MNWPMSSVFRGELSQVVVVVVVFAVVVVVVWWCTVPFSFGGEL